MCTPTWSSHSGLNVNESSSQCPVLGHSFVLMWMLFFASVQRQEDDWSFWKSSWSNRQFIALDTRIRRKYRIHVVWLSIFCLCWALGKPSYKVFMFCFVFIFPKKSLLPHSLFLFSKVCNSVPRCWIDFILTLFDSVFRALSNDTTIVEIGSETKNPL